MFRRQSCAQKKQACLLFETLSVTAVTEASEMVSGSGPPPMNMPWRSRFSVSRIAGSSGDHIMDMIRTTCTEINVPKNGDSESFPRYYNSSPAQTFCFILKFTLGLFLFFLYKSWWQIITSGNGHTQHLWYFCLTNCSQVGWSTLKGVVSQYEFVILASTSSLIWPYLRSSILATDTSVPVLLVSTVLTALHGSKQSFICSVEKLKEDNRFALLSRKQSCIIVDATAWTSLL